MSPLFFKRLSDEILGSRLASGEAAAFDELYRRYANRLAAYGAHLLGDAGLGDDVSQQTMLKAYGALREGRVPAKMKPWLFRIAHNVAIDLVVRRRELPSDDLPESPAGDKEPFAGTLVAALATLPDRQRRVYVLREVHGLRIDETAAELGLTTPQVEQALFAARNRLAEQLVFGDRLNCVTVQRLASGPLDTDERRALKTHLRTCTSCRRTLGARGRALSLFPAGVDLDWLIRLGPTLIGGGAPAAAKVGAVVATATIAAGVPVAVEKTRAHAHRPMIPYTATHGREVVSARPVAPVAVEAVAPVAAMPVAQIVPTHRAGKETASASHRSGRHEDASSRHGKTATGRRHGEATAAAGSGRRGRDGDDSASGSGSGSGSGRDGGGESGARSGRDGDSGTATVATGSGRDGSGSGRDGSGSVRDGSGSGRDGSASDRDGSGSGGDRTTAATRTTTTTTTTTRRDGGHHGGDRDGRQTTTTTTTTTPTTTPATTTSGGDGGSGGDGSGSGSGSGGGGDGGGGSGSGGGDGGGGSGSGSDGGGELPVVPPPVSLPALP